jgi:hypothetical protein
VRGAVASRVAAQVVDERRARAAALLRSHRMPDNEIRVLVTTEDPDLVRRILELHEEWLEEELADRRRALRSVRHELLSRISDPR